MFRWSDISLSNLYWILPHYLIKFDLVRQIGQSSIKTLPLHFDFTRSFTQHAILNLCKTFCALSLWRKFIFNIFPWNRLSLSLVTIIYLLTMMTLTLYTNLSFGCLNYVWPIKQCLNCFGIVPQHILLHTSQSIIVCGKLSIEFSFRISDE